MSSGGSNNPFPSDGGAAIWKLSRQASTGNLLNALAAGTYLVSLDGSIFALSAVGSGRAAFWFDPADYDLAGRTANTRLRLMMQSNAVPSTAVFTAELCPIASFGGAASAVPIVTAVGAPILSVSLNGGVALPASSQVHAEGPAIPAPNVPAGWYAFCLAIGPGMVATSTATGVIELQVSTV